MKKFLLLLFVLFFLVLAALAFFVFTFDANHYKPQIVDQIKSLVGQPVDIDSIRLGWRLGPAIEVKKIVIYRDPDKRLEPLLNLAEVSAAMSWKALFDRKMQVSQIEIDKPVIYIELDSQGRIKGLEKIMENAQKMQGEPNNNAQMAFAFLINQINVADGELHYRDPEMGLDSDLVLNHVEIQIRDVSLFGPIKISSKASLLSESQNLKVDGIVRMFVDQGTVILKNFEFETALESFNLDEVAGKVKGLDRNALPEKMRGKVTASLPELKIIDGEFGSLQSVFFLKNGFVSLKDVSSNIENIESEIKVSEKALTIDNFVGSFAGGRLAFSGKVDDFLTEPLLSFQLTARSLLLEKLIEKPAGNEPYPSGKITATFKGTAQAVNVEQTLSGVGRVVLEDVKIHRLNVLRELFNGLSIIPGLVERLKARLPEAYQQKFKADETILENAETPLRVESGQIFVDDIRIAADSFETTGAAQVSMQSHVNAQMIFRTDKDLSAAFIRSVDELRYLANQKGQLEIPYRLSGQAPMVQFQPDLGFIASRLAVSKTQDLIGGLLEKNLPRKQEQNPTDPNKAPAEKAISASGSEAEQAKTGQPLQGLLPEKYRPAEALVGDLLQNLLAPKKQEQAQN